VATDRLKIYNGALLLCGERQLATLSENREPRFLLDLVWNDDGVRYCLEQAQWHFAMRSSRLDYEPSIEPEWGFNRGFTKPDDWVATSGIFQDESMKSPLTDYADEQGIWYAYVDEIYVRYVSDNTLYGMDYARWPATFTDYVKAYFASRIIHRLPGAASKIEWLIGPAGRPDKGYLHKCLLTAKNKAAMTGPATFPTRGTWVQARHGNTRARDGGSTTRLIG